MVAVAYIPPRRSLELDGSLPRSANRIEQFVPFGQCVREWPRFAAEAEVREDFAAEIAKTLGCAR